MTIHSIVIQKLLSTNAHLGRRVAEHHFKIYTCGSRNGGAIIDSDKTLICLRNACHFIGLLVREKARFLFVNTNPLFNQIVDQMTKKIGCSNNSQWRKAGFLTNSSSPKKFRSRSKKIVFGSAKPPDCVVIMDSERKSSVILEADRLQIPIVSLVDSSIPLDLYRKITYPVPANDSREFIYLFCNLITKTFLFEKRKIAAREEETGQLGLPTDEICEEEQDIGQRDIDSKNGKVFVVPYGSVAPASQDLLETKINMNKLAGLKLDENLTARMGFEGPISHGYPVAVEAACRQCNSLSQDALGDKD